MYGLDQVVAAPESQIILCEGPRKAEAAKTFFAALPCIGYAGGCQSWKKTDWSPVAGRRIIMWPDADDKGRQSFAALAQHLVTLGCQVWILDTSDKAEGWDAFDAIEEGYTPSMIMAWAKASKGEQIVAVEPEPEPTIADDYEQHIAESITHPAGEEWTTEPADLFAEFWSAYPKKIGKDAAAKAFGRRKPGRELLQNMLDAIDAQKLSDQWRRDGGQYIPNPATWLNQGRWQDGEALEDQRQETFV